MVATLVPISANLNQDDAEFDRCINFGERQTKLPWANFGPHWLTKKS